MPTNEIQLNPDGSFPLKEIEQKLYDLLEEYSVESYPAKHREHLGASVIGEKCDRKLFYMFRWVKLIQFEGRMRRLFKRGFDEEPKIDAMLQWMGFFVREIDPVTDKQYKFSEINGHYGGSGDGIGLLPWFRDESQRILIEKKTHKDKLYHNIKTQGLKNAHPKHWSQMCVYAKAFKLRYGLYIAVNKDNDDIHFDFLELDWNYATQLENKARNIILSRTPPAKISENPAAFECKYCDFQNICHYGEVVEENCRSCKYSQPIENGQWKCDRWGTIIPGDKINVKYECHMSVNE